MRANFYCVRTWLQVLGGILAHFARFSASRKRLSRSKKKAIFEMAQRYANLPFHVKTAFVGWLFGSLWLTADGIA